MRCQARTRSGVACARAALRGGGLCASHAGRCGARGGNRNAVRHGLYSRSLSAEERPRLAAACEMEGADAEIGVTRLMIERALRQPDVPPAAYARLVHALCRQIRLQRQLAREEHNAQDGEIARLFDEAATAMGLGAEPGEGKEEPGGGGVGGGPVRRRARRARPAAGGANRTLSAGRGGAGQDAEAEAEAEAEAAVPGTRRQRRSGEDRPTSGRRARRPGGGGRPQPGRRTRRARVGADSAGVGRRGSDRRRRRGAPGWRASDGTRPNRTAFERPLADTGEARVLHAQVVAVDRALDASEVAVESVPTRALPERRATARVRRWWGAPTRGVVLARHAADAPVPGDPSAAAVSRGGGPT
jgi:hypothetical protein